MALGTENNYIILADDDDDDRTFFKEAFSQLNFALDLHMVYDGYQLMDFLKKPGIILPQLVLLDLNMPMLNGFQCLDAIKEDEVLKTIPVVIYSTSRQPLDIDTSYNKGAHFYIRKPHTFPQLKKVILKVLVTNWVTTFMQPAKEKFEIFDTE